MDILIIEPDKSLAKQYVAALSRCGNVRHAVSAQDAILAVDEILPNVIVLELLLAGHNGIEFLYELRSYADAQNVPVILNTFVNHAQFTSDESLLHELGIKEYLYKPTASLKQLESAVNRVHSAMNHS